MDERFLCLGVGVVALCSGVHWAGWSQSSWVWGFPFALIPLFLGLVGTSPRADVAHFYASMNTDGHPSERRPEPRGHESAK